MSDSNNSPPSPDSSSSSNNETSGDSSPPSSDSKSTPPSSDSSSSPPSSDSSSSPPTSDSSSSPPSSDSSSSPPSSDSSSSPPSSDSSSSPPSSDSSSSPPSSDSSSSPPSSDSSSSPPSSDSSSSPPSSDSSSSPPSSDSSSSPPSSDSSSSPPSSDSSSSPPSSDSSTSPPDSSTSPPSSDSSSSPPSSESSSSPPSANPSPPSNYSDSTSSSPYPPPQSLSSPPSSSESDSPSQSKPSDGGSSPPASSKSDSPTSSTPPKTNESPPVNDENSPSKSSESDSSHKFSFDSPPSDSFSSRNSSLLIPPSIGSSKNSSNNEGTSVGAVVSLGLAGFAITLIAIFFVIARRKKKRMGAMVNRYQHSSGFSLKSDNYYHSKENPMGPHSFLDPQYGAPTRLSNTSLSMYGSQRDQAYYSGPDPSGAKSWFSYEELMDITNGFCRENIIGEGGFGCVYKGALSDGKCVAVKQLKAGSGQGEREFRAEVEIISRVHHRHLVSLVGYGIYETQRLLVYEFVPNNTLEHHLYGKGLCVMDWSKRQKIAIGSAKGLAYLHEDCHPRIIHRDIKSANILIDNDWEAQVADFGLAKLSNDTHTHVSTRVMGTFGYLAPEYASSGKLTDRSDVFSFGVVLLELITGRRPVDASQPLGDESLVEWARPVLVNALETGNFDQLADPRLENNYAKIEMFRMIEAAAACIRHSAPKRPRMVQVVRALDCEGDMADLSNGMKFGQSQVYDSRQNSTDIQRFRRMALGTEEFTSEYGYSGEYDSRSSAHSGEHRSREHNSHNREYQKHNHDPRTRDLSNSWRSGESSGEFSGDSETRAMFRRPGERNDNRYGSRGFP